MLISAAACDIMIIHGKCHEYSTLTQIVCCECRFTTDYIIRQQTITPIVESAGTLEAMGFVFLKEGAEMDALDFISDLPQQLKLILTEGMIHQLYEALPEDQADIFVVRIVRACLHGEHLFDGSESAEQRLLLDLLLEKVFLFGKSMLAEEGEHND